MLPEYGIVNMPAIDFNTDRIDPMFEDAARLIVRHQQGSHSLIQRKLKLGYNRAGRIIDQLEAAGIVGPFEGSKAREVNLQEDYALEMFLQGLRSGKPSLIIPKKEKVKIEPLQVEQKIIEVKLTDPVAIPSYPIQHEQELFEIPTPPIKLESKSNKKNFWDWLFK